MAATLDKNKIRAKRTRKKIWFILLLIADLIITPVFAYVIHQCFSWLYSLSTTRVLLPQIDFSYKAAWHGLFNIPGCRLWWWAFQLAIFIFIIWLRLKPKADMGIIRENEVTDTIKIPCAAGQGQYGSERFLTEKEKDKIFETFIFSKDEVPKTKTGIVVEMKKKGNKEYIKYVNAPSSAIILGATRSGKTRRLLLQTMWMQILHGITIVASDIKGELFHYTHKFAKSMGYEIYPFDLRYPKKSIHYNFCQPVIDALRDGDKAAAVDFTWDLVSALVGESKGEPIWYNGETAALAASILAVCVEASTEEQRDAATEWVHDYFSYVHDIKPTDDYLEAMDSSGEGKKLKSQVSTMTSDILCGYVTPYINILEQKKDVIAQELLDRLDILMEYDNEQFKNMVNLYYFIGYMGREDESTGKRPLTLYLDTLPDNHPAKTVFLQGQIAADKTRASFYTAAMGTLRLFTNPNVAEMTSKSGFKLQEIGKKKSILYMMVPDEKDTLYPLVSLLVQQLYMELVRVANEHGGQLPVSTDFDLDELGNFPRIMILAAMITAGQSRGIRGNLVLQDYQQLEKRYEKDAETIKSNCTTKIYLKSDNPKTLKEISEYLGKYTVEMTSVSTSASHNAKGGDGSASSSSNLGGRELLTPAEISSIQNPYTLVMYGGRKCITMLPDLSQYQVNKLLGLGNEEYNRQLIMRQEKERPERETIEVPLWGIWDKYKAMLEAEAEEAVQTNTFFI